MNKWVTTLVLFLLPFLLKSQAFKQKPQFSIFNQSVIEHLKPEGKVIEKDSLSLKHVKHSPHKASIYSAVLPGLGQAYNKKYWKIPLVYVGLIGTGLLIDYNRWNMRVRQKALIKIMDNDTPDIEWRNIPVDVLRAQRNQFRTNRDYSIIGFAGIYLINIVDAAIDAHFYNFNIDKPLAMQKTRHWYFASSKVQNIPAFGFAYRF